MTFTEDVSAYRFRLFGPRFEATTNGDYVLPRPNGSTATVLESSQLVLDTNNVYLGPVEAELKAPLRELTAGAERPTLACGAVVNASVRHMPADLAFVAAGVSNEVLLLAGMLGNDEKACIGCGDFGDAARSRDAFRARFDERRSVRHSFVDRDCRTFLAGEDVPPIGVFLHDPDPPFQEQVELLRAAEPLLADGSLVIVTEANRDGPREAVLDVLHSGRRQWQIVLDQRTAGDHPTLGNGLLVLRRGTRDGTPPIELATDTELVAPVDARSSSRGRNPRTVSVLHYGNPFIGIQDYRHIEVITLDREKSVKDAFERSTGRYVVVIDEDVQLTPDALSQAVRAAEGGSGPIRSGTGSGWHRPVGQTEYFPGWSGAFDDTDDPQTVTVARALSVTRDNLVGIDIDPQAEDPSREIAVRLRQGLRLEGPAARCSRVPDGVVAGRVGAVLTPDGRWLIDSVGAVGRAWPELAIDDRGRVEVTEPARASEEEVATVASEVQRTWWTTRYGHWTFDVLTRVAMLLRAQVPSHVKLLVPDPVLDWQRETLVGLGIAEDRIIAWDGRPTRFRTVYVPTARPAPPFVFPAGVELLRELAAAAPGATPARRLYVSRRQLGRTPRITNECKLVEAAAELGFVEVAPEALAWPEQLRLFSEAEVVTGPHGSGLANAVFMAHGTGVCELAPAGLHAAKVPNFWDLAACGRQRYGICVGGGRSVDPKRFKRVLREVVRASKRKPPSVGAVAHRETQKA